MPRRREYERSPRQRLEWHGGRDRFALSASTKELATQADTIDVQPRLQSGTTRLSNVVFPAGIVRGETCAIKRFTAQVSIFDISMANLTNDQWNWAFGFYKAPIDDDRLSNPQGGGGAGVTVLNPLHDLRESWLIHRQGTWIVNEINNTGRNFVVQLDVDTRNSRVFEANDGLLIAAAVEPWGTPTKAITPSVAVNWRALLAMD